MFHFVNFIAVSGPFLATLAVLNIPSSLALTKTWIKNYDWGNTKNWNPPKLPSSCDTVNLEGVSVFLNTNTTIKQLVFPKSGSLVFGNSAELSFMETSSSVTCGGDEISFTGYGSNDWFDPNNWQSSADVLLHPWKVPCQYDVVRFPKDSSFQIKVSKNVTVSRLFIGDKEFKEEGLKQYTASSMGMQQIKLAQAVSFKITGKECADTSGCICGNDKQKEYICKLLGKCPELSCKQIVKPHGGCCSVCGTLMLVHISDGFNKVLTETKIRNYLNKFPGVTFTSVKIEDRVIQVVFQEKAEGESRKAAHSIREQLLSDEILNILKIEIIPKDSSTSPAKKSDSNLKTGLVIGIPVFVLVVLIIILVVTFLVKNKRARQSGPVVDDVNTGEVENRGNQDTGDRINPLYDSSVEMENLGFNNALSPTEESGRVNPLYESGETVSKEDK